MIKIRRKKQNICELFICFSEPITKPFDKRNKKMRLVSSRLLASVVNMSNRILRKLLHTFFYYYFQLANL